MKCSHLYFHLKKAKYLITKIYESEDNKTEEKIIIIKKELKMKIKVKKDNNTIKIYEDKISTEKLLQYKETMDKNR